MVVQAMIASDNAVEKEEIAWEPVVEPGTIEYVRAVVKDAIV